MVTSPQSQVPSQCHNTFSLPILTPTTLTPPAGDGLLEMTLSVEEGTLVLPSASFVCADGTLEGSSVNFRGSLYAVNDALSGLLYLVRSRSVADSAVGAESTTCNPLVAFAVLLLIACLVDRTTQKLISRSSKACFTSLSSSCFEFSTKIYPRLVLWPKTVTLRLTERVLM